MIQQHALRLKIKVVRFNFVISKRAQHNLSKRSPRVFSRAEGNVVSVGTAREAKIHVDIVRKCVCVKMQMAE